MMFGAQIRLFRQDVKFFRGDVQDDGLSKTVGLILYRHIVPEQTRIAQAAQGIDPYREVLKTLRRGAR